jgi:hypothetical protein
MDLRLQPSIRVGEEAEVRREARRCEEREGEGRGGGTRREEGKRQEVNGERQEAGGEREVAGGWRQEVGGEREMRGR